MAAAIDAKRTVDHEKLVKTMLIACQEVVRAVESRDQRAIWEAAKLCQVEIDNAAGV